MTMINITDRQKNLVIGALTLVKIKGFDNSEGIEELVNDLSTGKLDAVSRSKEQTLEVAKSDFRTAYRDYCLDEDEGSKVYKVCEEVIGNVARENRMTAYETTCLIDQIISDVNKEIAESRRKSRAAA